MEPLNINLENIVSNQEQTERAIDTNMEFDFDDVECMLLNGYFHNAHSIQKQLGLNSVEEVWAAVREHRIFYVLFKGMRYFPTFYGSQIWEQKELECITKALKYMPSALKIEFFFEKKECHSMVFHHCKHWNLASLKKSKRKHAHLQKMRI